LFAQTVGVNQQIVDHRVPPPSGREARPPRSRDIRTTSPA
jgi:hypothetical protein